jgi:hypothetical protein
MYSIMPSHMVELVKKKCAQRSNIKKWKFLFSVLAEYAGMVKIISHYRPFKGTHA